MISTKKILLECVEELKKLPNNTPVFLITENSTSLVGTIESFGIINCISVSNSIEFWSKNIDLLYDKDANNVFAIVLEAK